MSDQAEQLLNQAVDALQNGKAALSIALSDQALALLQRGDSRVPEALSLRGTAKSSQRDLSGFDDLRQSIALDPKEPQFHMALGQALFAHGRTQEAEAPLFQAFQLSRGKPVVANLLGRCLIQNGKAFQAVQVLGPSIEAGRATAGMIKLFAEARFHSGDIYGAKDVFDQLYGATGPQTVEEKLQLARICMALRDYPAAQALIDDILRIEPRSVEAHVSALRLADWLDQPDRLSEQCDWLSKNGGDRFDALTLVIEHAREFTPALAGRVEAALKAQLAPGDEFASLGLAYALRLDREKRFDQAWSIAQDTNQRWAEHRGLLQTEETRRARRKADQGRLETALRLFQADAGEARSAEKAGFIYLIGAPRTGSSLIQSILAGPEGVESVGERTSLFPYLWEAVQHGMSEAGFASYRAKLAAADQAGLARQGVTGRTLVDKTPHHLYVAGLLERINPGARFIQVLRDAGDVGLSMFLRPFSTAFPEATDLHTMADVLSFRLEARQRWVDAGLPISVFSYDGFTQAPEAEGERLFRLAELDWNEAYLNPNARPEPVQTFSSRQVRKPISARQVPHWKSYEMFAPDAFERLSSVTDAQNAIIRTNLS